MNDNAKLGLLGLVGVVVSTMVGSGVFSLPQNMAQGATAGAVITAWIITGIGMFFIVDTFRMVSTLKPNLTSGIYSYAQDGFGKKVGFFTAWGYWLCNIFANTGYAVILMESLNYFFPPYFKGGNNLTSLISSTIVIWAFFLLASRGIKTAALVNFIGTVFKLIPIAVFILVCLIAFRLSVIMPDIKLLLSGAITPGALVTQIKSTMLITLWCFIGIESAIAISARAKVQSDVSKATIIAFFSCLSIYILISIIPFGILPRETLASFPNPSTAGVLESVIGKAGGLLMIIGLMISVLFSWLSWFIVASEVPYGAVKGGASFPKEFAAVNGRNAPVFSLLATTIIAQAALGLAYFSEHAWDTMLNITGVMVMPVYLMTALYLIKLAKRKHFPEGFGITRRRARLAGILGSIYAVWLIYAANVRFMLLGGLFLLLGVPIYLIARKQKRSEIKR